MTTGLITKAPAEVVDVPVLANRQAIDVTATPTRRNNDGGTLSASGSIVAGRATVRLAGGVDGEEYRVDVRADLADGQVATATIDVLVLADGWVMPDGTAGYVSIADFVKAFGLAEVVEMTSSGDGRIDKDLLIQALRSAQGIADLNIGARYQVPITSVPDVVMTAICDIARARLYPRGAPDGIATPAKDAVRMLERIASGAVRLPFPENVIAPAVENAPIRFRPGRLRHDPQRDGGWGT